MREWPPSLDIRALLDPAAYPHPVDRVELVETHLSWLLLAGEVVYKINRPVVLDFVDFSSPEQREASCREGLRLNRRLAPQLYLGVVGVTLDAAGRPRLEGDGLVIEYALKMRRFDQTALLGQALPEGRLQPEHVDQLAERIAGFHQSIAVAAASSAFGSPGAVQQSLREVLAGLMIDGQEAIPTDLVHELDAWCQRRLEADAEAIRQRQSGGWVRECHGDLHLGNMFLEEDRVTIFDCIDFDPALRWIDVMNDLAFCVMDLQACERQDLAHRLLDRYLQHSGDYAGLRLLRLYVVYRALVRAKVARLRLGQLPSGDPAAVEQAAQLRRYLQLAERSTRPRRPQLVITHGLSGSGKSWLSAQVGMRVEALQIRSDLERRRVPADSPEERYAPAARARVYARLLELAEHTLAAGSSVIVDATFLERAQRETFHHLAQQHDLPFHIIACTAPEAVLRQRISTRAAAGSDPSEADQAVLDEQLQSLEPLAAEESPFAIVIDSQAEDAVDLVTRNLSGS